MRQKRWMMRRSLTKVSKNGSWYSDIVISTIQYVHIFFIFLALRWRFPPLPWDFTVLHNDPAAPLDHSERCRIRTRGLFPRSLARCQWAATSPHLQLATSPPHLQPICCVDVGSVPKSGGGRGRSLSVIENSEVDKEVGNALRKVRQQV